MDIVKDTTVDSTFV